MSRKRTIAAAALVLLLGLGGGIYGFYQKVVPNLRVVRSGVLWRSGQPNALGLEFLRLAGVKTIVCLRDSTGDGVQDEADFARRHGIRFIDNQLRYSGEGIEKALSRFLDAIADPASQPVLVHCSRGKERTGVCTAVFRIAFDGWTNERALQEMYGMGFKQGTLPALESFVASYTPRAGQPGPAVAAGERPSSGPDGNAPAAGGSAAP